MADEANTEPQTQAAPGARRTKAKDGEVMVRVLPKGHGKVHTGKVVAVKVQDTEEIENLRTMRFEGEIGRREALRRLAEAEARNEIDSSVAAGQTYPRGARFALPLKTAQILEDRGFVEILED